MYSGQHDRQCALTGTKSRGKHTPVWFSSAKTSHSLLVIVSLLRKQIWCTTVVVEGQRGLTAATVGYLMCHSHIQVTHTQKRVS